MGLDYICKYLKEGELQKGEIGRWIMVRCILCREDS